MSLLSSLFPSVFKKKEPPLNTLIDKNSRITGNIVFAQGMRIEGEVVGNISADTDKPSMLVISETGKVTGEVVADLIVVNGKLNGPVHARTMLELHPNARIEGDVQYAALEMHQGALISGRLVPSVSEDLKPTLKLAANNQ